MARNLGKEDFTKAANVFHWHISLFGMPLCTFCHIILFDCEDCDLGICTFTILICSVFVHCRNSLFGLLQFLQSYISLIKLSWLQCSFNKTMYVFADFLFMSVFITRGVFLIIRVFFLM